MRRIFGLVFWVLAAPAFAVGEVTEFELDNGLQIVVIEDHRAPIVTHMLWYRVGAADEPVGKSGIAHFLEHLLFKGTKNLAPGAFSEIVAAQGGVHNAFTAQDYTAYYQRVAVDRLPLMMQLEADRMKNLQFTAQDARTELSVVLEERKQRTDSNPRALFAEHMNALSFVNHPYGIPVIGWEHEIKSLTRADAFDFYHRYYAPNNAILIVAGDVMPAAVLELAKTHYGALEPSDAIQKRIRAQEPPKRAPVVTVYEDERVAQPYLLRSYYAPTRRSGQQKEAAALSILASLLGGSGVTSYLAQRLQLDEKITLSQSAWYSAVGYDANGFGIWALPAPGVSQGELTQALDKALADFLDKDVDQAHLDRVKTQIRASQTYALDDQSGTANTYGRALSSGLTIKDVQDWSDVLNSITRADIMAVARQYLHKNNSVTGWIQAPQTSE